MCVYLKTGDQSSYASVKAKGWATITRSELIAMLGRRSDRITNAIFRDFLDHIRRVQADVEAYETKAVDKWDSAFLARVLPGPPGSAG